MIEKNGIKIKLNEHGTIGKGWAAEAIIRMIKDITNNTREERGLEYALKGRVYDLEVKPGLIQAKISGSKHYTVKIDFYKISEKDWLIAAEHLSKNIELLEALKEGKMPPQTRSLFRDCVSTLLPRELKETRFRCSCPDNYQGKPCKHIIATFYVLAYSIDNNPDILFFLRGIQKKTFLSLADNINKTEKTNQRKQEQKRKNNESLIKFWGDSQTINEITKQDIFIIQKNPLTKRGPIEQYENIYKHLEQAYEELK